MVSIFDLIIGERACLGDRWRHVRKVAMGSLKRSKSKVVLLPYLIHPFLFCVHCNTAVCATHYLRTCISHEATVSVLMDINAIFSARETVGSQPLFGIIMGDGGFLRVGFLLQNLYSVYDNETQSHQEACGTKCATRTRSLCGPCYVCFFSFFCGSFIIAV